MPNNLDIELHLRSFAEEFVLEGRRDKWLALLAERPDTIRNQSTRLFNYLDHNYIEQNNSLVNVTSDDTLGIYYDFDTTPKCIAFKRARECAKGLDGVFSVLPGELVIYFARDGWSFVCKK